MRSLRSRLFFSAPFFFPLKYIFSALGSAPLAMQRACSNIPGKLFRPPKCDVQSVVVEGLRAEWIHMPAAMDKSVVLYLHGGAYTMGSCNSHRRLAARVARACRARLLLPEYRLAPEHPYPIPLEDAVAAYRWLLECGVAPQDIAIAGDSAGGGLAMAVLVFLRDAGDPLPAATVCMSPWTDLKITGASLKTKAKADPFLKPAYLRRMAKDYIQDNDPRTPTISPIYADLQGLPPLLIQVGSAEILQDDAVRLADRAREAGVDVTLEVWEGMVHVWQFMAHILPEGRQAIEKIGIFVRRHTVQERC
jgi:acetyl esterase/lipase